jgi:hypothetical protein
MKKLIISFILLFLIFCLFAQNPEWSWVVQFGSADYDDGSQITSDESGNIYLIGSFNDTATFGSETLTSFGERDIYITKMDTDGNLIWVSQAGGISTDIGIDIETDNDGNIYITGSFWDTIQFGSLSLTSFGANDIFIAKLDSDGNWLWVAQGGGISEDMVSSIAIDDNCNAYITGGFFNDIIFGTYSLNNNGYGNLYIAIIDSNGTWQWANQIDEGTTHVFGQNISIVNDGNLMVTGSFYEGSVSFGPYTLINNSYNQTIFVAKMDSDYNWLWAVQALVNDGASVESGKIVSDYSDNTYITGNIRGSAEFGSTTLFGESTGDVFTAKLDDNGNWTWATQANDYDTGSSSGHGIALDINDDPYIIGRFSGTILFGDQGFTSYGWSDVFISKLDQYGNWIWATYAGSPYSDSGNDLFVNNSSDIFTIGVFSQTATFGTIILNNYGGMYGGTDIFIAKLCENSIAQNNVINSPMNLINYPNPFNPSTSIEFAIQNDSQIELSVFNNKGQTIKTLFNTELEKGNHSIIWNGVDEFNNPVSSGIYYYKLDINGKTEAVKKCLLLK